MGSVETDMNWSGSLSNHENLILYEGLPYQGPLRNTVGREFFNFLFTDPPHRKPRRVWRQSSYLKDRVETIPVFYLNTMIFMVREWTRSVHARFYRAHFLWSLFFGSLQFYEGNAGITRISKMDLMLPCNRIRCMSPHLKGYSRRGSSEENWGVKKELTEFIPSGTFAVDNHTQHNQNHCNYANNNKHCTV